MSTENKIESGGSPVRQLLKAYWRCWRGDLRGTRTLTEAMIARDNSDKVARRLLTKIAAKQAHAETLSEWEPTPVSQILLHSVVTVASLYATACLLNTGFHQGFADLIYLPGRNGGAYCRVWLLLLFSLLWNIGSVWVFVRMITNRKW